MRTKKPQVKRPVGRPPDLTLGETFSIRLGVEEEMWFRRRAKDNAIGVSVYIRMILTAYARAEISKETEKGNGSAKPTPKKPNHT